MNEQELSTQPASPLRAVAYLRMATAQRPASTAIQAQRAACEHRARELAADLVCVYTDAGRSGMTGQRPGFQQMMARIRTQRDIAYVITYDLSRISRRVTDAVMVRRELDQLGARIISATAGPGNDRENAFIQALLRAAWDYRPDGTAMLPCAITAGRALQAADGIQPTSRDPQEGAR